MDNITLEDTLLQYQNTKDSNDSVWLKFKENAEKVEFLLAHRTHIEKHQLGYGDFSFHYMWLLLLTHLKETHNPKCLEIGVFKGQVISLWSLIAKELDLDISIYAISPFEGNADKHSTLMNNRFIKALKRRISSKIKSDEKLGNSYPKDNYLEIIDDLFNTFDLEFNKVNKMKGLSSDEDILSSANRNEYDLIYIDGDHSYEAVKNDILNYSKLIKSGGYLVIDDASSNLEGSVFWKGHKEVSKATDDIMPSLPFDNILNVGHNRVFRKQ